MNTVDLHTHTTFSDGTYTPQQIIDYAIQKGLSAIAITDHDTLDGVSVAMDYASDKPIEVISGIELSTSYFRHDDTYDFETEIHIVGLFLDTEFSVLSEKLTDIHKNREKRNLEVIKKFNSLGIPITLADLEEVAGGNIITRAHFAKALLKGGYITSTQECFDRYLGKNKPAYVPREKLDYTQSISLIEQSGGIAVLAHPLLYKLGTKSLETMLGDLKNAGLTAIEAIYSTHSPSDIKYVKMLAQKNKLLISGGSDFHGDNKPKLDLATGYGNLCVPYEVLEDLKGALNNGKGFI